ncbi:effector-associated constant component EACC1 [Streptomyces sp. NPDC001118]
MSSLRLSVTGDDSIDELTDLADWLQHEPELRGLITFADPEPGPGELGALADALAVAVGSGGVLTVLAASLRAYVSQPRKSDVRILVRAQGRSVTVEAKRVNDVEALLRETLRHLG